MSVSKPGHRPADHHAATDLADQLWERFHQLRPWLRCTLAELIAMPSISQSGHDPVPIHRSAERIRELLREEVGATARLVGGQEAQPAVLAAFPGPPDRPTVLLYSHHDVQPPGPAESWTTDPFSPTERNGRLYGRGSVDNKSGVIAHLAALRLWNGRPPARVIVLVEGEEEIASPNLEQIFRDAPELRDVDIPVVADGASMKPGHPAINLSLRGRVGLLIEVETLTRTVHAGVFGGAIPDALTVLIRLLATLHNADGSVAVDGMLASRESELQMPEEDLRRYSGLREGVGLIGAGSPSARLWNSPAISVRGMDVPSIAEASGGLLGRARAQLAVSLAPGDDPERAAQALQKHIRDRVPWGAHVRVRADGLPPGWTADTDRVAVPAMRAAIRQPSGREPDLLGLGGSLKLIPVLKRLVPKLDIVMTAIEDAHSNIHGGDESIDLQALDRLAVSQALFLKELSDRCATSGAPS